MSKEKDYNGFTIQMALVDIIPVIFFALGAGFINKILNSPFMTFGIACCLLGGLGKVAWKMILAFAKKDIPFLFKQMRIMMPLGFLLMIVGIIIKRNMIVWTSVLKSICSFPALLFFIIGVIGITCMFVMAKKLDPQNPKSNWIEQCTNIIAQGGFCLGIIFSIMG